MYFVQKEGVYSRGVFWFGGDEAEGIAAANRLASQDRDHYHEWALYEFVADQDAKYDPKHRHVYSVKQSKF